MRERRCRRSVGRGRRRRARRCSVPGASETSSKPYVGRIGRPSNGRRGAAPRRWDPPGLGRSVGLLFRLTVGCLWPRVYQRLTTWATGDPESVGVELEPGRPFGIRDEPADALDRLAIRGPDRALDGSVPADPLEPVVLGRERGPASGRTRMAKMTLLRIAPTPSS